MQQTFTSRLILGFALTVIVLTLLFTGSAAAWAQQRPSKGQRPAIQSGYPRYASGINETRFEAEAATSVLRRLRRFQQDLTQCLRRSP